MDNKQCAKCENVFELSFFYKRNRANPQHYSYCKNCFNDICVKRQQDLKKRAVEYKGGQCELCGYNKYYGALEFHHIDPSNKDKTLKFGSCRRSWEKVRLEIDKCSLVCANCHREQHSIMNASPEYRS